ncbi:trypsin-2-like [Venturia canescens]|uniref:trypsin-2-like n=1 Tax=Venturia canescens TaxID=32260 RepID=UPI001C9CF453|nr:trypsin-2-like [Venturia canescens]
MQRVTMMGFRVFLQFYVMTCSLIGIFGLENEVYKSSKILWSPDVALLGLEPRIVNGTKATLGQFPHQVSLRRSRSNGHFCGGNIIAPEWILTAGHCMFNRDGIQIQPWTITVVAGQVVLGPTKPESQKRAVEAILLHADFERDTLTNDVALLKLTNPLVLNTPNVRAARFVKMPVPIGTVCEVAGWGYLSEEKPWVSNDLMFVSLPTMNIEYCRELYKEEATIPDGAFCAGYDEGLRDACLGDSGGGMVCGGFLAGVVSGGKGCAEPKFPGAYSDVYYFRDWIRDQMRSFNATSLEPSDWEKMIVDSNDQSNGSVHPSSYFSVSLLTITYTFVTYFGVSTF